MNKFESMSFRKDFVLPIEEQDRMLGFIKWGKKNDYPYFLIDLYNYISYFDLLDDSVFQSKFLSANIEIGNKLSEIANSGDQIKPQDRYLVIQIALMNWYNIKNEGFDINKVLKKVKYNLDLARVMAT